MVALLAGCEADPGRPESAASAPKLPDPARIVPDLTFFDRGEALAAKAVASQANFINAYVRVVVVDALAQLVLAPPVAAFAEEVQIRLRGREVGDSVEWALRVTALSNDPPFNDVLWFAGTTRREGAEGRWTFHDPELAGNPASGELTWGADADGDFLALECLLGDDAGDRLTWRRDGTGSLMVPDCNGGRRACWNAHQDDTVCPE